MKKSFLASLQRGLRTIAVVSAALGAVVMVVAKCSTVAPAEPVGHQTRSLVFEDGGCDLPLDATMDLYAIDAALVTMNTDTIANGSFVRWVEGVSGFQTGMIKSQIAAGAAVPATISALNARLNTSTYLSRTTIS